MACMVLIVIGPAPGTVFAEAEAEAEEAASEQASTPVTEPDSLPPNWLDKSHRYVSSSTGAFVDWIDRFFGAERSDIESAYSLVRITEERDWEESAGSDSKTRVRGKVRLPRINRRLSLLISDEEEDEEGDEELPAPLEEDDNKEVSGELQYTAWDKVKDRLDFKVGLRSNGRFKSNVRYRYEENWGENAVNRITETIYYVDGDGFRSRLALDHDRRLSEKELIRWSNRFDVSEEYDGVKWSSQFSYADRLGEQSALTYYTWVSGVTQPEKLTRAYGVGSRYRTRFYRPWLYLEMGPTYVWERSNPEDDREGSWRFAIKLEALLEYDRGKRKR